MLIVDAHCDTALSVIEQNADMYENQLQLDIKRLLEYGKRIQFFSAFAHPSQCKNSALSRVLSVIDAIYSAEGAHGDVFSVCRSAGEIELALAGGKVAALITVEGGECLDGELSVLRQLYRLGVRSMMLTWNHRNLLADGAEELHGAGLSMFGRRVVEEMDRLGIIVDVSHLCEASFNDVMEITKKPVIASHSNSWAICRNPRNLTDSQLSDIAASGGVVGVNFYPFFLNNTCKATIDDIIRHVEHICAVAGEDHVGIGSDFDGIECTPEGMEGTQCIPALFERLARLNYSSSFIEKFAGLNFMRVIRHVLR